MRAGLLAPGLVALLLPALAGAAPPGAAGVVEVDSLPASLAGTAEFAFGDPPDGPAGTDRLAFRPVAVPGSWQDAGYPGHGTAWYRFRFRLGPRAAAVPLAFVAEQIRDADEAFLDGVRVGGLGGFPPDYDKATLPSRLYALPPTLTAAPGVRTLLVRVYNPGPRAGGITGEPEIDALEAATWRRTLREAPLALAASAIVALGLFALLVFLRDRRQYEFLFFFLFMQGVAIYISTWLSVWARWGVSQTFLFRVNVAHSFALAALFPLFFHFFFVLPIPAWQRAVVALQGCAAVVSMAWPRVDDLYRLFPLLVATILLTGGRILQVLVVKWRQGAPYAGAVFGGFALVLLAVLGDVGQDLRVWQTAGRLRLVGPAFLVFATIFLSVVADRMARLRVAASTDPLTGLANRATLWDRIDLELARAQRNGRPVALALLDLDRFKDFNDRHGHLAGDRLLIAVGETLVESIRSIDLAARFGGEEFVVLLPETGREEAVGAVERIRMAVSRVVVPGTDTAVTTSIGLAVHTPGREPAITPAALLRDADVALYRAKAEGRNRSVVQEGPPQPENVSGGVRFPSP